MWRRSVGQGLVRPLYEGCANVSVSFVRFCPLSVQPISLFSPLSTSHNTSVSQRIEGTVQQSQACLCYLLFVFCSERNGWFNRIIGLCLRWLGWTGTGIAFSEACRRQAGEGIMECLVTFRSRHRMGHLCHSSALSGCTMVPKQLTLALFPLAADRKAEEQGGQ